MKKIITVILLFFLFFNPVQSVRIITGFDIARWFLDSDIVLIGRVSKVDTLKVKERDSLTVDNIRIRYQIIREKYQISVDSVIKSKDTVKRIPDKIYTPDFSINYSIAAGARREFVGFSSEGDSIFKLPSMTFASNYDDNNYFRLSLNKRQLIILSGTESGYVIDFASNCDTTTLNFIREVKEKGEKFFPFSKTPKDEQ